MFYKHSKNVRSICVCVCVHVYIYTTYLCLIRDFVPEGRDEGVLASLDVGHGGSLASAKVGRGVCLIIIMSWVTFAMKYRAAYSTIHTTTVAVMLQYIPSEWHDS